MVSDTENPLHEGTINDFVDYKGHPVSKSNPCGWRSASFVLGVEVTESFAFFGLASNLITYLRGPLGQSDATAAENVNAWCGAASLLPLVGAIIADSFLGHYRTVVIASQWRIGRPGKLIIEPWPMKVVTNSSKRYSMQKTGISLLSRESSSLTWTLESSNVIGSSTEPCLCRIAQEKMGAVSMRFKKQRQFLSLIPIWATNLLYANVDAQCLTFFTKQGATMYRTIASGFIIPAATLQSFTSLTIVILVPIYDRIFAPLLRALTRKPTGITMLQRIGNGFFSATISMVVAALAELKRLKTAEEYWLVDLANVTIPMSVW
ncbi:unnamed protein product [Dovyalis caffra]|uniref:Uncharacterized protein n=1 Tax=Dovyalis caffra TaxID=77055 RepID=A0AAV1S5V1_9ROSI|nr:unnamed protein product [Dovyalis caffra]